MESCLAAATGDTILSIECSMTFTNHELSILKEYMQDLIDQARQETLGQVMRTYARKTYTGDEALLDLLALLDDRVESEGAQLGLSEQFLHRMWNHYRHARDRVGTEAWLIANIDQTPLPKARIREITYRAFLDYLRSEPGPQA